MKSVVKALVIAALLAAAVSPLVAQEPVQAPDTSVQGYAPPAPTAAPAAQHRPCPGGSTRRGRVSTSPTAGRSVAEALGFIDVIPFRSVERIRTELESAKAEEREADARISETTSQRERTKSMVEVKKRELSTVDARIKLADKQKAEADKTTLTAEKKSGSGRSSSSSGVRPCTAPSWTRRRPPSGGPKPRRRRWRWSCSSPGGGVIGLACHHRSDARAAAR